MTKCLGYQEIKVKCENCGEMYKKIGIHSHTRFCIGFKNGDGIDKPFSEYVVNKLRCH